MIIDNKELFIAVLGDLMKHYDFTEEEADNWLEEYGDGLIESMWNEYTSYLEYYSRFKH